MATSFSRCARMSPSSLRSACPAGAVQGRVVSTYGGIWETGPLSIVALSRARATASKWPRLALYRDPGAARAMLNWTTEPNYGRAGPTGNDNRITYYPAPLAARNAPLYTRGQPVEDSDFAQLPAERYGLVMVFRTFTALPSES